MDRRCQYIPGVQQEIVAALQHKLHEHTMLVNKLNCALQNIGQNYSEVGIRADQNQHGEHQHRYNAPVMNLSLIHI